MLRFVGALIGVAAMSIWSGLVSGGIEVWTTVKPFKRWKAKRQAKKDRQRREAEAAGGEFIYEDEDAGMNLGEKIGNLRTSTKAGAVGLGSLGAMAVMLIPFAEEAEVLIQQACQSENGAVPFLVGGAVVWATTVVSARLSKTPAKPGVL